MEVPLEHSTRARQELDEWAVVKPAASTGVLVLCMNPCTASDQSSIAMLWHLPASMTSISAFGDLAARM